MRKKYLHVASFEGNAGDAVNHLGFYRAVGIEREEVQQIEIRRFYHNYQGAKLFFDNNLIELINNSKALILGGGGFFDVYWDDSYTGTTIDMRTDFIDKIQVPVLVNAMGIHFDRTQKAAIEKFYKFYRDISTRKNWLIAIRNDGSAQRFKEVYSENLATEVECVPDNGFAFLCDDIPRRNTSITVGLNITNDLLDSSFIGEKKIEDFNFEMSQFIKELLTAGIHIVFFLHAPQDIKTLSIIQDILGKEFFRANITIAPYEPSDKGIADLVSFYKRCDAVVAMRFHANVICLANNIPVVGLAVHEQITGLYEEIGLKEMCIRVGEKEYTEKLMEQLKMQVENGDYYKAIGKDLMNEIVAKHRLYANKVRSFINVVDDVSEKQGFLQ